MFPCMKKCWLMIWGKLSIVNGTKFLDYRKVCWKLHQWFLCLLWDTIFFFKTGSHIYFRLSWNSLYRLTHRDPPTSATHVQGLKVCTNTPGWILIFLNVKNIFHLCLGLVHRMVAGRQSDHFWLPRSFNGFSQPCPVSGTWRPSPSGCYLREIQDLRMFMSPC